MSFAQNLEYFMKSHGYSKYRVSQMTGFSQTTINNWLIGKTTPYEKEWEEIAAKLKTTPTELFDVDGLEDQKEKPITADGDGLDPEVSEIMNLLESASAEKRKLVLDLLKLP